MAELTRSDVLRQIRDTSELALYFEIRSGHVDSVRNYQLVDTYGKKRRELVKIARDMGISEDEIEEEIAKGADRAWDSCSDSSDDDWGGDW